MAYDWLRCHRPQGAVREYLSILELAAHENETRVDEALGAQIAMGAPLEAGIIKEMVKSHRTPEPMRDVVIDAVDLGVYDELLGEVVER